MTFWCVLFSSLSGRRFSQCLWPSALMTTGLCFLVTPPAPLLCHRHVTDSLCSRSDHGLPVSPAVSQNAVVFRKIASDFLQSDAF